MIRGDEVDGNQSAHITINPDVYHDSDVEAHTDAIASGLLSLPAEIRAEIWTRSFMVSGTHDTKNDRIPGIIQTCHKMRSETYLMFFALTRFRVDIESHDMSSGFLDLHTWLLSIEPRACAAIKHIEIILHVTHLSKHRHSQPLDNASSGEHLALIPWDSRLQAFRPTCLRFDTQGSRKSGQSNLGKGRFCRLAQKMLFVGRLAKMNGLSKQDLLFVARKASGPATPMPRKRDLRWLLIKRWIDPVGSAFMQIVRRWRQYPWIISWDIGIFTVTRMLPFMLVMKVLVPVLPPAQFIVRLYSASTSVWSSTRTALHLSIAAYLVPCLAACALSAVLLTSVVICWAAGVSRIAAFIPNEPILDWDADMGLTGSRLYQSAVSLPDIVDLCIEGTGHLLEVLVNVALMAFTGLTREAAMTLDVIMVVGMVVSVVSLLRRTVCWW